jgi:hypothetical protein
MNQKPGSQSLGSFIAPIGSFQSAVHSNAADINLITDLKIGRKVLTGTMSPNGLFGVAIEKGRMWLIPLKGVSGGSIRLRTSGSLHWPSKLQKAKTHMSAMSVSIVASYGRLEIVAVDCWNNIISKVINIPNMPAPLDYRPPSPSWELPQEPAEFPGNEIVELCAEGRNSGRGSVSAES